MSKNILECILRKNEMLRAIDLCVDLLWCASLIRIFIAVRISDVYQGNRRYQESESCSVEAADNLHDHDRLKDFALDTKDFEGLLLSRG